MPFEIVRNDITKMEVDAIVNAANTALKMGGGVCGAIFRAAGAEELQEACDKIGGCPTGQAVITEGFRLPAKYIIHTPGPIWQGGDHGEAILFKASYENSLKLAKEKGCESIAFPLISTGIYGYPKDEALQIAVSTISSFLLKNDMHVYLVVFDKSSFQISQKLFHSIKQYIDEKFVKEQRARYDRGRRYSEIDFIRQEEIEFTSFPAKEASLLDVVDNLEESFTERLFRFIDEKGLTDVETYKRANLDRRLFSKIRNTPNYHPKKKTALALAIALELNLEETLDLLATAGYTLSPSSKFDVIIQYFIEKGNYNIFEINEALFFFDQDLLGG